MDYWQDYIVGTGAAVNLEIGFIPDVVRVTNLTDRDAIAIGVGHTILPFDDSTGTTPLEEGDLILGATSKARGVIKKVLVHTGSWGGSNAQGFLVLEHEELEGTFQDNDNIQVVKQKGGPGDGNTYVTLSGASVATDVAIGAAVAAAGSNITVKAYDGTSAGKGKGVTLGSALSEDNKLLLVEAFRSAPS